ncbi:hypothetical protein [Thauera humireducens]|uniref:Uncharacterized protein n=1 Tax=Thauera humireducens TaxID=1134435 RepID=A0A127KAU9_9RHOO|nr:hypothetical protein [Thauera humireducens]AMO38794.1 hypothetical protein AC731_018675 [Thauera humireducens]
MPASTPLSTNKTAALSRTLDGVTRGYFRYIAGTIAADKVLSLARKFHDLYGIGCTPSQRITRKNKGLANSLLVLYAPEGAALAEWLLLVSPGNGPVTEREKLRDVTAKPRLTWLGYELLRHRERCTARWTWRRSKAEMTELYQLFDVQLHKHDHGPLSETLARIARQPGFHGVRVQSWTLFQHARERGYRGELPYLFYVSKVSHGERISL